MHARVNECVRYHIPRARGADRNRARLHAWHTPRFSPMRKPGIFYTRHNDVVMCSRICTSADNIRPRVSLWSCILSVLFISRASGLEALRCPGTCGLHLLLNNNYIRTEPNPPFNRVLTEPQRCAHKPNDRYVRTHTYTPMKYHDVRATEFPRSEKKLFARDSRYNYRRLVSPISSNPIKIREIKIETIMPTGNPIPRFLKTQCAWNTSSLTIHSKDIVTQRYHTKKKKRIIAFRSHHEARSYPRR